MGVSKRLRFEIFKRDGFICQYCGRRPPDVVLELDHIHPRSKGGSNEEINLLTSCEDCNRGKSDKLITDRVPRPDADLNYLEAQQEIAEADRFLYTQEQRRIANSRVIEALQDHWQQYMDTGDDVPSEKVFLNWLSRAGAEDVSEAIRRAARGTASWHYNGFSFSKYCKYVGGCLRNIQEEK